MKRLAVVAAAIVALAVPALAQTSMESYIELLRSDLKTEKKAIIAEVMDFTEAEETAFWPIYREYEVDMDKIIDQRLALIREFGANYDTMTDEKAKELVEAAFKLEEDRLKLERKYFQRVAKATSAITAGKFSQVTNQINLLVRLQIATELPLLHRAD